jgi:hypothetical protein
VVETPKAPLAVSYKPTHMTIVHISDDIKQEFKIDLNGKTIVSIRGAARIAGVSEGALRKNLKLKGAYLSASKMAEMLIESGCEGAYLSSFSKQGIPDTALAIILEYYAYEAEENCTQEAKLACRTYSAIGIRTWIQNELGYQKQEQPIEPTTQPILPVEVNQSKVFIVGDDNGVKAMVPHDQIEKLLEIATLRKFKQTIDPIMFEGLDSVCLALPLELIEALNEQLQIAIKLSAQKSKPLGFGKPKKPKNK